jgi:hypothetical protein
LFLTEIEPRPLIVKPTKSRKISWAEQVAYIGEIEQAKFLWETLKGRHNLKRPERKWKDNTEILLREIGCESMDWIELTQSRVQCWASLNR